MPLQCFLKPRAQGSRLLEQFVSQRAKETRKLLLRPIQNISREKSSSRSELPQRDALRRSQRSPHLFELPRQQPSEHRMHIARCIEVTSLAELRRVPRVVAELRIVEA